MWEVTDGTEMRFCKEPLNVPCSTCDGPSTCEVLEELREVLYCSL